MDIHHQYIGVAIVPGPTRSTGSMRVRRGHRLGLAPLQSKTPAFDFVSHIFHLCHHSSSGVLFVDHRRSLLWKLQDDPNSATPHHHFRSPWRHNILPSHAGVGADDHHSPLTPDHLAAITAPLYRCRDLHVVLTCVLLESICDAATGEVVRRQLHAYAVAGEDADEVHPQLAADVRQYLMLILELDPEHGVRQRLDDRSFDLDCISLSHRRPLNPDY